MPTYIKTGLWETLKTTAPKNWLNLTKLINDSISSNLYILQSLQNEQSARYSADQVLENSKQNKLESVSGNTGVGKTDVSATEKLDVNGNVKANGFKTPTGTATQALTANGGTFDLTTKLDKGTYTGTAQDLKTEIETKQKKLSSFDESILIETDGNIEGNISLFSEYFNQQICELNFIPIQIVAVYQDGIKLSNSEYEIILPKKIKIKEYVDENIQIEYTHLKS